MSRRTELLQRIIGLTLVATSLNGPVLADAARVSGGAACGQPTAATQNSPSAQPSALAATDQAEQEVARLVLALRARLADLFNDYSTSRKLAETYRNQVIPEAEEAFGQYLSGFRQMKAAYPQVLIAQRTLVQSQVEYMMAQSRLWESVVTIRGMLLVGGLDAIAAVAEPGTPSG
ncbi:MAG: TolC family protein [Acidobacteriota bacterium]